MSCYSLIGTLKKWWRTPAWIMAAFFGLAGCSGTDTDTDTPTHSTNELIANKTQSNVTTQTNQAPPIDDLAEKLRQRLHANPEDRDGWVLLARSYSFLGDHASAEGAMNQARSLGYQGDGIEGTSAGTNIKKVTNREDKEAPNLSDINWNKTDVLSKQMRHILAESEPEPTVLSE